MSNSQISQLDGWFVYIVETSRGKLYTGISMDVLERVRIHNLGKGSKALRGQLPVHLVWRSEFSMSKSSALKEEYRIKRLSVEEKRDIVEG
jgi:putative endonuclease